MNSFEKNRDEIMFLINRTINEKKCDLTQKKRKEVIKCQTLR